MKKDKEIKVSVLCVAYNHEKFLRECLESFVCQKTNFSFEIIVHDDKSTDGTVEIINEYVEKYPDLIVPILEETNQYSLGKSIVEDCILPYAKGKYVAICEGDDKWCDENKLQTQFDFMEQNLEYVACFHNTILHDLCNDDNDRLINNFKAITELTGEMFLVNQYIHTSSFFIKRENCKKVSFGKKCWMGDFVLVTSLLLQGKLAILPSIMSIHNYNNPNGVMNSVINRNYEAIKKSANVELEYLKKYDEYSGRKYTNLIKRKIAHISMTRLYNIELYESKNVKEYREILKKIRKSEEYKIFYNQSNLKGKIKMLVKYHLPRRVFMWLSNKG